MRPTEKIVERWLKRAASLPSRRFEGYIIVDDVDEGEIANATVSLVTAYPWSYLPPHKHERSDAHFLVISGNAAMITGWDGISYTYQIGPRDWLDVPRNMFHGFSVGESPLVFLSIQSPAIRNPLTGIEDFVPSCNV